MGILSSLRLRDTARQYEQSIQAAAAVSAFDPSQSPIAAPEWWGGTSSHLERLVFEDIVGSAVPINTRAAAMRIPAVARARNLLVSTICRFPLVQLRAGEVVPDQTTQPTWMYRCDDGTSPQTRLAWTVDDLIFYGWSLWWRRNGTDKFPLSAGRVNQGSWWIDHDTRRVVIDGVPQDDDQVILFAGLHEGLLSYGKDTLDDARALMRTVKDRLANPAPQLELHQVEGRDLTPEERKQLVTDWAAARQGVNGGVGFTSKHIETKELGASADSQLLIEARNAAAVDLARAVGVSAGLVDATTPKASLNYETKEGRNEEFADRDLYLYMTPIEARLSLDDIVPRGSRTALDLSAFTGPALAPTGPNVQD